MRKAVLNLTDSDRRHLWHPFTQMAGWIDEDPPVIVAGQGSALIDENGKKYLDGVSSLWCNVHGHRHPLIDRAVRRQLGRIAHSTLLGLAGEASIRFAEKLCGFLPAKLGRIFYSDNGSTAAEVALKMAYSFHVHRGDLGRRKFITFDGAYHGDTIGSVSVGGIDLFHAAYRPLLFETHRLPYPFCFQCPWSANPKNCGRSCFGEIEAAISRIAGECAGLIVEPLIQGASGMRPAPKGFLAHLRKTCDRHGLMLIADEVATGFGRTGTFFACEQENVVPDLMTLAKGITGGYLPLAVTAASEEIYETFLGRFEEFKTFFHGHTYTGNALACAAGLGSLEVFEKERVLEKMISKIETLSEALEEVRALPHVADVRQVGFMTGIELMEKPKSRKGYSPEKRMGHEVIKRARTKGVILRPLSDVVVLNPPLCFSKNELKRLVRVTAQSIRDATGPNR